MKLPFLTTRWCQIVQTEFVGTGGECPHHILTVIDLSSGDEFQMIHFDEWSFRNDIPFAGQQFVVLTTAGGWNRIVEKRETRTFGNSWLQAMIRGFLVVVRQPRPALGLRLVEAC